MLCCCVGRMFVRSLSSMIFFETRKPNRVLDDSGSKLQFTVLTSLRNKFPCDVFLPPRSTDSLFESLEFLPSITGSEGTITS